MKISPSPEFKTTILQRIHDREFKERTGVHCSDLLYCLNKQALRRLNPQPALEHETLTYSIGWSTQRWLTGQDRDAEEKEVDGIIVTCDELIQGEPWELKATFTSKDKPIDENDSWLRQIMAQCYVQGTTKAYLTRLELMGNWKSVFGKKEEKDLPENRKPTLSAWRLEFTDEELRDNWLWLKRRASLFRELLQRQNLLSPNAALPPNHEWECKGCPPAFRKVCKNE